MPHINIQITGKVQGVFYRDSTRRKAEELGVTGMVRNQPDGSVYAEAEGSEEAIHALAEWCKQGPQQAQVHQVTITPGEMVGYTSFEIKRG